MIISEHLDASEAAEEIEAAARWQRERAWSALERWESDARRSFRSTICAGRMHPSWLARGGDDCPSRLHR